MDLGDCRVTVAIYLQLFLFVFLQSLFRSLCFGLRRLVLKGEGVCLVLEGRHTNEHTSHAIAPLTLIQVNLRWETTRGAEQGLEIPARWCVVTEGHWNTQCFDNPVPQGISNPCNACSWPALCPGFSWDRVNFLSGWCRLVFWMWCENPVDNMLMVSGVPR